jgi:UDP-N-acetylglucosamine 2-epimerase (non-hydrolysing)
LRKQQLQRMPGLRMVDPLGYLAFSKVLSHARLVLTDSGGVQEETTALGVPCLTLRHNTERPITIEAGTNQLVGLDPDSIVSAGRQILATRSQPKPLPRLWDGRTAIRILDVLEQCAGVSTPEETGIPSVEPLPNNPSSVLPVGRCGMTASL